MRVVPFRTHGYKWMLVCKLLVFCFTLLVKLMVIRELALCILANVSIANHMIVHNRV